MPCTPGMTFSIGISCSLFSTILNQSGMRAKISSSESSMSTVQLSSWWKTLSFKLAIPWMVTTSSESSWRTITSVDMEWRQKQNQSICTGLRTAVMDTLCAQRYGWTFLITKTQLKLPQLFKNVLRKDTCSTLKKTWESSKQKTWQTKQKRAKVARSSSLRKIPSQIGKIK